MFNVICAATTVVIRSFDNGAEAAEYVRQENNCFAGLGLATRYRIMRAELDDTTWRNREMERYHNGTYQYLPWYGEDWEIRDHYAHVSVENNTMIGYTRNTAEGRADVQKRLDTRTYLNRYYGNVLSAEQIDEWIKAFDIMMGRDKLLYAETPEDIERVYTTAPIASCMSHKADYYISPVHPVRVYGAGDLACAYMINSRGEITGRAIVWKEKGVYSRLYGDMSGLRVKLREAGFREGNSGSDWDGAKLLRIEHNHRFVAPYLDDPMCNVSDNGEHLIIDNYDGEILCRHTNGLSQPSCRCHNCGEVMDESYTVDGDMWCESCTENDAFWCASCEEHCSGEPEGTNRYNESICEHCARHYYDECHGCNHLVSTSETIEEYIYCRNCAQDLEMTRCDEYNANNCECETCTQEDDA